MNMIVPISLKVSSSVSSYANASVRISLMVNPREIREINMNVIKNIDKY